MYDCTSGGVFLGLACASAPHPRNHFRLLRIALTASRHRRPNSCSPIEAFAFTWAGRIGTPLLRFCPLQRLLTALRCPGLPAAGRSRFGFELTIASPEVFRQR